ncbi:MAG TPA: hypothetical protein VND45_08120 [Thermoanaerobaculia bacterium]|nr:hypothetical protein [Thermoanaerobaculia bacterium]
MKSLALVFLLFATAAIEVNSAKLADGATETFASGSRTVSVHRSGNTTTVRVEEGERVDTVTLTREGGKLSIGHKDNGVARRFIVVDRPKVIVDGIVLEPHLMDGFEAPDAAPVPDPKKSITVPADGRYFICPKDATVMRVPTPMPGRTFKCPVDGTEMKSGLGPGSRYFLLQ